MLCTETTWKNQVQNNIIRQGTLPKYTDSLIPRNSI